jgi:hypothetical protein
MEPALRLLVWAGVIAATAVTAAVALGALFGSS